MPTSGGTDRRRAGLGARAVVWLAVGTIRLLLRFYPAPFRERFGGAMVEVFRERAAAARARGGLRAVVTLWARTLCDLGRTALAERRHSSLDLPSHVSRSRPPPRRADGMLRRLLFDLTHAVRSLYRHPGSAALVVSTLAIGIAASTAIFSVVDGVLLRPLPYEESEELLAVWSRFDPESGFDFPVFVLSEPEYLDYRRQSKALDDLAAFHSTERTIGLRTGEVERVEAVGVTDAFFEVLGVDPLHGRAFTVEEDRSPEQPAVILHHGYWQQRFGGDPSIVGEDILVNGVAVPVVGVMPPGFDFPSPETRIWLPSGIDPANPGGRSAHYLRGVARLADGVPLEEARAELAVLMEAWQREFPAIHTGHYLFVRPLLEDMTGRVRPALVLLLVATGFLLLIVCANVANIVLARSEERRKEISIRAALGARPGRMVQLLLGESLLLALCGGAIGVLLARWALDAVAVLHAGRIPRADAISVDHRVLAVAALVTTSTAIAFGLVPALRAARTDPREGLSDGARGTSDAGAVHFRRALVVAQVALSFVLVLGAGLVSRSFVRLLAVDPGYRVEDLFVARLSLPSSDYPEAAEMGRFYRQLVEATRALPAVENASVASSLPLGDAPGVLDFEIDGRPAPGAGEIAWNASFSSVRPGWFETVEARLRRGRFFEESDGAGAPPVAVIDEVMAERFFPGTDPIGQRMRVAGSDERPWMTIVGVVDNLRLRSLAAPPHPQYFVSHEQLPDLGLGPAASASMYLMARTTGDPVAIAPSVRAIVAGMDPGLPVYEVQTMERVVAEAVAPQRFTSVLLVVFSGVALMLGATGIYGVLAYSVACRRREIGIRMALGARRRRLAATVMMRGIGPVLIGLVIGSVGSIWTTRLMSGLLFEIRPGDVPTHAGVALLLGAVAVVACAVPTWRALRVDPLLALRSE